MLHKVIVSARNKGVGLYSYFTVMLSLFQYVKRSRNKFGMTSEERGFTVNVKGYLYLVFPLMLSGCAAPLVGGLGAVGMSAVEDRGLSGVASDQTLRLKLNVELSDQLSDFGGIELTIYKGRVLFTGVVANESIKKHAVQIAQNVVGVKEIIDRMNVKGEDGFSEYTRDSWMTTKLKAALYADDDIIAPNYLVKTFDKTIYIFGTAQTQEEMNKVMSYAFDITGVKNVVNLMEVLKK